MIVRAMLTKPARRRSVFQMLNQASWVVGMAASIATMTVFSTYEVSAQSNGAVVRESSVERKRMPDGRRFALKPSEESKLVTLGWSLLTTLDGGYRVYQKDLDANGEIDLFSEVEVVLPNEAAVRKLTIPASAR